MSKLNGSSIKTTTIFSISFSNWKNWIYVIGIAIIAIVSECILVGGRFV